MIDTTSGVNWLVVGAVLFGLANFGALFSALVVKLGQQKDGFTSLFIELHTATDKLKEITTGENHG